MMKKVLSLLLLFAMLICPVLTSCSDEGEDMEWEYTYNPYYNRFKDEVPTGKKIRVSGNVYIFSEIMIRNKDEEMQVTAQNSLGKLYQNVLIRFVDEKTVEFTDYSGFFPMEETEGQRQGNVLTVENTNVTGDYTYEIRIEIHKDKILVIHNAHFYDTPGTYATITFTLAE